MEFNYEIYNPTYVDGHPIDDPDNPNKGIATQEDYNNLCDVIGDIDNSDKINILLETFDEKDNDDNHSQGDDNLEINYPNNDYEDVFYSKSILKSTSISRSRSRSRSISPLSSSLELCDSTKFVNLLYSVKNSPNKLRYPSPVR